MEYAQKIVTEAKLLAACRRLRQAGKRIVFTNGHFELLHLGHVRYLQEARALGDCLIVGLNADATTRRHKGAGRPLLDEHARAEILAALACVDHVLVFPEDTAERLVGELEPDVYVKGGDYAGEAKAPPEARVVEAHGGRVVFIPLVSGYSTTTLIREIVKRFGQGA